MSVYWVLCRHEGYLGVHYLNDFQIFAYFPDTFSVTDFKFNFIVVKNMLDMDTKIHGF